MRPPMNRARVRFVLLVASVEMFSNVLYLQILSKPKRRRVPYSSKRKALEKIQMENPNYDEDQKENFFRWLPRDLTDAEIVDKCVWLSLFLFFSFSFRLNKIC